MKLALPTLLFSALFCTVCMCAQNTGAQATPQTQNATPAGIRGPGASQPGQRPNNRTVRGGALVGSNASRRGGSQSRSRTPAPAANSSVTVIGGDQLHPQSAEAQSVALPGVSVPHNMLGVAAGTPIHVRLKQTIDSGHAKNGDTVQGTLAGPLGRLASGSPVQLTVVAAAPAGEIGSSGVLSLQVISINGEQVLSQVITAEGKQGSTLVPDAAPTRGTEAVFTSETALTVPAA